MVLRKAAEEIATRGGISANTRKMIQMLKGEALARGQLQAQEASTSFTVSADEAHNVGEYLRRQG